MSLKFRIESLQKPSFWRRYKFSHLLEVGLRFRLTVIGFYSGKECCRGARRVCSLLINCVRFSESWPRKFFPAQNILLSRVSLLLSVQDSRRGDGSDTHSITEEQNSVLGGPVLVFGFNFTLSWTSFTPALYHSLLSWFRKTSPWTPGRLSWYLSQCLVFLGCARARDRRLKEKGERGTYAWKCIKGTRKKMSRNADLRRPKNVGCIWQNSF